LQWEKSLWHSTNSKTRLIQFTKKKKKRLPKPLIQLLF
jgi:hypothetical protein